ncbi:maltooligosyltrehalose trehalohydrolase [Arcanobacterium pluranimalium]|uniref:malto-oligosyltrehalose trehalohydrolase n=1 Tax=Arcanobacterium pluranimalium TaxID=108028 RepID=UPI00195C5027|nr:malto-oligosyltrehalose trehalohydrolase [Arcanobacterium pluranimalium]MBM7825486.1 maltooligosyltrehalose trehalohydrolase [Arcanobacterium pluranimalium]
MSNIEIWAPHASEVQIKLHPNEELIALVRGEDDVWRSEHDFPAGTRYFVVFDGGLPVPDPRSRRQPLGVHGPTEIIDPGQFTWTDQNWVSRDVRGGVFYELHIGTFTPEGTFEAAISKLDHLVELGIDVVEIMPVNPIPGRRGWGYDGVSIMATYEEYGSPQDFAHLIDELHARGIHACLDVVYNHFGPDGNYLGFAGPYLTDKHHTPWGNAVNLDGDHCSHVRKYFLDNICQWARDFHIDVFRVDATDFLIDDSSYHFLAELSDTVHELGESMGKHLTVTFESDANNARTVTPTQNGGRGADMQWADDVHHALHVWLTGESNAYYSEYTATGTLPKVLRQGFYHDGIWTNFDKKIRGCAVPEDLNGHALIVFDENHDQVGNRLIGDRPSYSLNYADLAISRALILLSHFTPLLFMGEEWAAKTPFPFFTDHGDEIGPHILEGRMNEFSTWDLNSVYGENPPLMPPPQEELTFRSAKLNWSDLELPEHARFFEFVQRLIQLRKSNASIASGDRSKTTLDIGARSGWMRRNDVILAFSRDGATDVVLPADVHETLATWDSVTTDSNVVTFDVAGVAVFTTEASA